MTEPNPTLIGDFALYHYDTLDSTQIKARGRVQNNQAKDGDIILTSEQTAGYGRRGRSWVHQQGNVYMTLTRLFDDTTIEQLPLYGFVASLAIAATCRDFLAGTMAHIVLKWPNDVLVNDAKISGILLERIDHVLLLGIGVNLVTPHDVDQQVAGLDQFSAGTISPLDFTTCFAKHFSHYETILRRDGFPVLRTQWLEQAKGQGHILTARLANGTILTGTFLDLDHHGALLLDLGDGTIKTISSADIFFNEDTRDV
jgi:BirA family biotin operon repressor/biotin-[acetyl-CoA-carboxylase] ligase